MAISFIIVSPICFLLMNQWCNHFAYRAPISVWSGGSVYMLMKLQCIMKDSWKINNSVRPPELRLSIKNSQSHFRVRIALSRDAGELFWKMFLGMYVSFLISYICFYIHADNVDSRFGLCVGALFAAIGNKYVIESSLPESSSFTLVDTLHGLTLFLIFAVITSSVYALKLVKENKLKQANRLDFILAQSMLVIYLVANIYFIVQAKNG